MKRLQRTYRDYTWHDNPTIQYVGRPTPWGNPFTVEKFGRELCLKLYRVWLEDQVKHDPHFLDSLKGKDLMCWCPINLPCHVDILLEFLARDEK